MGIVDPVPFKFKARTKSGPVEDRPGVRRMIWVPRTDCTVPCKRHAYLNDVVDSARVPTCGSRWCSKQTAQDLASWFSPSPWSTDTKTHGISTPMPSCHHMMERTTSQVFLTKWGEQRAGGLGTIERLTRQGEGNIAEA